MRHNERLAGGWRGAGAGGCPNFDTYVDNPRFRISAASQVDVLVELEAAAGRDAVAVGLHLRPEAEGPGTSGESTPLKLSSGDYRGGFCMLEARALPPGRYTLIASTFNPGDELNFELRVSSSQALDVASLPHEAAGLKRQIVRGEWSDAAGTAAGSPNHGRFHRNPQYRLTLSRPSEVLLRLRCAVRPRERPSLLLAIFARPGPLDASTARLSCAHVTSCGGVYCCPAGGALVPRTAMEAGAYVCVPSTFDKWAGPFELVVCAPEGAVRIEQLPG